MLKKAANIIIFLQILVLVALGVLLYFLYKVRVVENINYIDVQKDITDNSISKIQAESQTLSSIIKKQDNPNFTQSFFIQNEQDYSLGLINIQKVYSIDSNTITKSSLIKAAIPSFYTSTNSGNLDDSTVIDLISQTIKSDSLSEIDIDVTITNKVENIENVIREIIKTTSPQIVKINLGIPLKWSDFQDYTYLETVSRFYNSNASIGVLNNLVNKFRIEGFGYTTLNSSNAGPVTLPKLTEDSIKYYIYKGVTSTKIDLVINNTGYMWPNRSYSDDYLHNFVVSAQQVIILNTNDLNNYLSQSNFRILNNFDHGENLGILQNNDNINYIVYPRLTQISSLIDLAKQYGLNGYIIKTF